MTERMKQMFSLLTITVMASQFMLSQVHTTFAAAPGSVVINEVAWAGSIDSSNDEWIELYNNTNEAIDLTNWVIEDDGNPIVIPNGLIPARGFFLIEDHQDAVANVEADVVIGLSLANSGDSLVLKDNQGQIVDTVNQQGGAWYAGNGAAKASMERKDPSLAIDQADNWSASELDNVGVGRAGSPITGTPKAINSNFIGEANEFHFEFEPHAEGEDSIAIQVKSNAIEDIYAYGLDIEYDQSVINFTGAVDGGQLGADGVDTFFQASLQDGQQGTVVVGATRLVNPPAGINIEGALFTLNFDIVGEAGAASDLRFSNGFIADREGDVAVRFNDNNLVIAGGAGAGNLEAPRNLQMEGGEERYNLSLNWDAPVDGADTYLIHKRNVNGEFVEIGNTDQLSFIDDQDLVIGVEYQYRVFAVLNGQVSAAAEIAGDEERGLSGDLDRSDRVDGRDVEILARSYGAENGEESYSLRNDTNFDAMIDGNDLITIGANFGLTY